MAIVSVALSSPGVGATSVSGTFATDAVAPLTTTNVQPGEVNKANNPVGSADGFPGRYITWPTAGPGGTDAILAVLGNTNSTTISIQSPGIQTATATGLTLTRWEQLVAVGQIRAFTITAANGDKWAWAAGDAPYDLKYTPNGGTQTVLANAAIVVPEQIHFAPGVLPASTSFTVALTING